MTSTPTNALVQAWQNLQALAPISVIRTDQQYDRAVATLNTLLDTVGHDETHPLYDLLDTLGTLIQAYEDRHEPEPGMPGGAILKFSWTSMV